MNIVLTGSVAFDYLMKFPGKFRDHFLSEHIETISLSFLVESMVVHRGGIAPNIAYTLALLGSHPRVMATIGEDAIEYRAFLESKGVDTTAMRVVPGVNTASFFANTDQTNAQIASFYPGAMGYAAQLSFRDLPEPRPDLAVISPNDPGAMRKYAAECRELAIPYVYDPSQQIVRMEAEEIRAGILSAEALFVNEYEFALIEKIAGLTREEILRAVKFMVVTCGQDGAQCSTINETIHVPVVPPHQIQDPTGVGDAFRGGFLTGYGLGLDLETCGQMGALAATYCLEHTGPQGHSYTPQEFINRFRQHFEDGGKLDILTQPHKE